jgi:hypothetical protein
MAAKGDASRTHRTQSILLRQGYGGQVSRESVYTLYIVGNQQPKCLHNSLHFQESVYIA